MLCACVSIAVPNVPPESGVAGTFRAPHRNLYSLRHKIACRVFLLPLRAAQIGLGF